MNSQNEFSSFSISPAGIDAIVSQARAERAEAMRAALSQVPVLFKRLVARLHFNREPQPRRHFSART